MYFTSKIGSFRCFTVQKVVYEYNSNIKKLQLVAGLIPSQKSTVDILSVEKKILLYHLNPFLEIKTLGTDRLCRWDLLWDMGLSLLNMMNYVLRLIK